MRIKICGITNEGDALKAVECGAWALGFIFYKESPRYISPSKARVIVEALPPFVTPVGVFVNHSKGAVREICRLTRIRTVQFHGDETPSYCKHFKDCKIIKAFRVDQNFDFKSIDQYMVDAYLFDTYHENSFGGTGKTFNWGLLNNKTFPKPFILSGGLNPNNIQEAIRQVHPFAVDVSSGVEESPGKKDYLKIKDFINAM